MGHWRLLEPGTTKSKASARVRAERKRNPKRKYRVEHIKARTPRGTLYNVYLPEVWYPN